MQARESNLIHTIHSRQPLDSIPRQAGEEVSRGFQFSSLPDVKLPGVMTLIAVWLLFNGAVRVGGRGGGSSGSR